MFLWMVEDLFLFGFQAEAAPSGLSRNVGLFICWEKVFGVVQVELVVVVLN